MPGRRARVSVQARSKNSGCSIISSTEVREREKEGTGRGTRRKECYRSMVIWCGTKLRPPRRGEARRRQRSTADPRDDSPNRALAGQARQPKETFYGAARQGGKVPEA